MVRRNDKLLLASVATAALFAAQPARGADGDADNAAAAAERDTIIVTGLRADEGQNAVTTSGALGAKTLLDTPFSITVIDSADIAKRQAVSIQQLFANDPSVFSFASAGTVNWWGTQIRGLPVRNYYVDDVPMLLYWGGDLPLENIETVEALKGLTGFMYGFGAPGGAISYRTKRPTAEPMLSTEIGYRTTSDVYGHVDAGGPLTKDGSLGYRLNVVGEHGTLYNDAQANRYLVSGALDYAVSPDIKWHATATYEYSKLKREPFHIYWDSYELGTPLPAVTYDYEKLNVDNSFYRTRLFTVATGIDWDFAKDWALKLDYGYTSKQHNSNKSFINLLNQAGDYDGGMYNFAALDKYHYAQAMVRGELKTGPIRHEIVAGASFIANSYRPGIDWYFGDSTEVAGNIYQNQAYLVTRPLDFTLDVPSQERQYGAFISDTVHFGEHVQLLAGVRRSLYKILDRDGDPDTDSAYRATATTPSLALIVKPAPYVSLYGSYVESMETGTRVGGEYLNAGDILPATISKQYEVGAKFQHGGLNLTAAAFRVERVNTTDRIVAGDVDGNDLPDRYLRQDGLAVYKGVEVIASYQFTRDLRLGAGVLHLAPRLQDVSNDIDLDRPVLPGNTPAEASRWQLTGNADYYVRAIPGLSVHANARHFGKAPTTDANQLYIPSYTTVSAGFQYETQIGERKVVFTGNVNNLLNEKYWGLQNFGEGMNGSVSAKIFW